MPWSWPPASSPRWRSSWPRSRCCWWALCCWRDASACLASQGHDRGGQTRPPRPWMYLRASYGWPKRTTIMLGDGDLGVARSEAANYSGLTFAPGLPSAPGLPVARARRLRPRPAAPPGGPGPGRLQRPGRLRGPARCADVATQQHAQVAEVSVCAETAEVNSDTCWSSRLSSDEDSRPGLRVSGAGTCCHQLAGRRAGRSSCQHAPGL